MDYDLLIVGESQSQPTVISPKLLSESTDSLLVSPSKKFPMMSTPEKKKLPKSLSNTTPKKLSSSFSRSISDLTPRTSLKRRRSWLENQKAPTKRQIELKKQQGLHKFHLLCNIYHGFICSSLGDNEIIQLSINSMLPKNLKENRSMDDDISFMTLINDSNSWIMDIFQIVDTPLREDETATNKVNMEDDVYHLLSVINGMTGTQKELVIVFVALLRSLNISTRYVWNIDKLIPHTIRKSTAKKRKLSKRKKQNIAFEYVPNWIEVFNPIKKRWMSIDILNQITDQPKSISKCNTKLAYIFAFQGCHTVADVTRRYVLRWSNSEKLRVKDKEWIDSTIDVLSYPMDIDRDTAEKEEFSNMRQNEPIPTNQADFKKHPIFVLEKSLLKYQVIHPDAKPCSMFKKFPVYKRSDVCQISTKTKWVEKGKQVKEGEIPFKQLPKKKIMTKKRRKSLLDRAADDGDNFIELSDFYGEWQVEPYNPGKIVDGKIPKNEHGNIYYFNPQMMPEGGAFLELENLGRIANKLKIDYARAVVGWNRTFFNKPVFGGYVVSKENVDVLTAAWNETMAKKNMDYEITRAAQVMSKWFILTKKLLTKDRLEKEYASPNTKTNTGEQSPKISPQKKSSTCQHDFIEEPIDEDQFLWKKTCTMCQFSLNFEKFF
eukprot:TRINITY_DN5058_c0_g1_i3.p1 TRINITY_DN5058_c0_g1~~TRINITY_DN5058_c0_g1_i3.p1  ORF type:complete len:659 (-),score=131.40 TRINITY_DN5058_c0_g1_i3:58-2034(-)